MIRVLADAVPERGATAELGAEEGHYLLRVRRCAVGDVVEIVGRGDGRRGSAVIVEARKDAVLVKVTELLDARPAVLPVHVLAAVPKRDLMDDVVRKLSEIGAASLTPIVAARSVVVPGEGKLGRWRRIADEAVRQCGRGAPLEIADVRPFEEALAGAAAEARLVLDPRAVRARFAEACGGASSIAIAVGPEGGFTAEELAFAGERGFRGVGLGATVLRVETAAIVGAALAVDTLTR
jgi:16S rRNA (uracil1498-N3)-methyltransferase